MSDAARFADIFKFDPKSPLHGDPQRRLPGLGKSKVGDIILWCNDDRKEVALLLDEPCPVESSSDGRLGVKVALLMGEDGDGLWIHDYTYREGHGVTKAMILTAASMLGGCCTRDEAMAWSNRVYAELL